MAAEQQAAAEEAERARLAQVEADRVAAEQQAAAAPKGEEEGILSELRETDFHSMGKDEALAFLAIAEHLLPEAKELAKLKKRTKVWPSGKKTHQHSARKELKRCLQQLRDTVVADFDARNRRAEDRVEISTPVGASFNPLLADGSGGDLRSGTARASQRRTLSLNAHSELRQLSSPTVPEGLPDEALTTPPLSPNGSHSLEGASAFSPDTPEEAAIEYRNGADAFSPDSEDRGAKYRKGAAAFSPDSEDRGAKYRKGAAAFSPDYVDSALVESPTDGLLSYSSHSPLRPSPYVLSSATYAPPGGKIGLLRTGNLFPPQQDPSPKDLNNGESTVEEVD